MKKIKEKSIHRKSSHFQINSPHLYLVSNKISLPYVLSLSENFNIILIMNNQT